MTKSGGFVSITFRLSALSALSWVRGWPPRTEFQLGLNYLSAQCPFGTDEERHPDRRPVLVSITFRLSALSAQDGFKLGTWLATTYVSITFRLSALSAHGPGSPGPGRPVGRLNYLSAQCPFGTHAGGRNGVHRYGVSITFRLSALSARILIDVPFFVAADGLNYLSAQCPFGTAFGKLCGILGLKCLNYLSAQCPFGTHEMRKYRGVTALYVSITFRLSALSARWRGDIHERDEHRESQLPFGSVPFRHKNVRVLDKEWLNEASQLPFGSVPFRHTETRKITPPRWWCTCLNYLSAQCPFGTLWGRETVRKIGDSLNYLSAQCPFGTTLTGTIRIGRRKNVSITFRLSALSAL